MNVQHIGQLPPKVSHDPTTDNLKGKRLDEFESAQHTKFSGKTAERPDLCGSLCREREADTHCKRFWFQWNCN